MSRVSKVVIGVVAMGLLAFAGTGCKVEASAKTKTKFTPKTGDEVREADWGGGVISIENQAPGVVSNGGMFITYDPAATKVRASARVIALGLPEEQADAEETLKEAIATFTVTANGTGVNVSCKTGTNHNNAKGTESGCEKIDIIIPGAFGGTTPAIELNAVNRNGGLTINMGQAPIKSILGNSFNGTLDATFQDTAGGNVQLFGKEGSDVIARLPADFAADSIAIGCDPDKRNLGPFASELTVFDGTAGRGDKGVGLLLLRLDSEEFAGSTGEVSMNP